MAKYCAECGAALPHKAKFCPECGNTIEVTGGEQALPEDKGQSASVGGSVGRDVQVAGRDVHIHQAEDKGVLRPCQICNGSGKTQGKVVCPDCNGKGKVPKTALEKTLTGRGLAFPKHPSNFKDCGTCNGSGEVVSMVVCQYCQGQGHVRV